MDLKLANKVVFVSGSSSGIGFSIAKVLYDEGCTVILNSRNPSSLKKSVEKNLQNLLAITLIIFHVILLNYPTVNLR